MKIEHIDINRCMDRNEQSIPHWNLNGNYTKCQGAESRSGNTLKPKSIRSAHRIPEISYEIKEEISIVS